MRNFDGNRIGNSHREIRINQLIWLICLAWLDFSMNEHSFASNLMHWFFVCLHISHVRKSFTHSNFAKLRFICSAYDHHPSQRFSLWDSFLSRLYNTKFNSKFNYLTHASISMLSTWNDIVFRFKQIIWIIHQKQNLIGSQNIPDFRLKVDVQRFAKWLDFYFTFIVRLKHPKSPSAIDWHWFLFDYPFEWLSFSGIKSFG